MIEVKEKRLRKLVIACIPQHQTKSTPSFEFSQSNSTFHQTCPPILYPHEYKVYMLYPWPCKVPQKNEHS